MKLSLVLVAGLVCATSVFGKVSMPKELHGEYYSIGSDKAFECANEAENFLAIDKDGTHSIGAGCGPTKISSSKNNEYTITMKCGDEEGGSYKETGVYKKIKKDLIITYKGGYKYTYKPCK